MGALRTASTVLALLALVGAAPVCEELVKPVYLEDLTPVTGKWWFLSGFSDDKLFRDILKVVNSSWISLTPSDQEGSLIMSQGNKINGKCEFPIHNITYNKNGTFHVTQMADGIPVTSEMTALPSGPGYLATTLTHRMANMSISSFYIFGRSAKMSETEQQTFQRQAECLGYSTPAPYIYDGVTELCDQDQHKIMCEPLLKPQEIKDPARLMGRWVFLEGFVDHKMFIDILKMASSAWMTWTPTPHEERIIVSQGNRLNGNCMISSSVGNFSDSVFYGAETYGGHVMTSKGWALPSGQDTFILHIESNLGDQKIRALYMFGRTSQVSATDKETLQKQAECLGWIRQAHYTYDGVTELCEEASPSP